MKYIAITIFAIVLTVLAQVYCITKGTPLNHVLEFGVVFVFGWIISGLTYRVVKWAVDKLYELI
jgi:hypothetical protein